MLSLLSRLRVYLWAAAVAIGGFLLLALGYLKHSRDKWKAEAKQAEAELDFKADVSEVDTELHAEYTDIRERAEADVKAGKVPENLQRPNQW